MTQFEKYQISQENLRLAIKRYEQSDKGKARAKRYQQSAKGKATRQRYEQSEKGKVRHLRRARKFYCKDDAQIISNWFFQEMVTMFPRYTLAHAPIAAKRIREAANDQANSLIKYLAKERDDD